MIKKMASAAMVLTGIALASPAMGQDEFQPPASVADEASAINGDGFRTAQRTDGFQLVEHGIWQKAVETAVQQDSAADAGKAWLPYRYPRRSAQRPSGFRRAAYLPHIYAAETKYSLPSGLLDALVWTESRYNPLAISKAGAAGLGQLMPGTAQDLGVPNRFDPLANLSGAARYLRQLLDKFGVVHLALAAYNAGPGAVERAGGIPRNGETPAYVRDVLSHWRFEIGG